MRASLAIVVRLAAREHEPGTAGQLVGAAYGERVGAQPGQHPQVLTHVALQREDADRGGWHRHRIGPGSPGVVRQTSAGCRWRP